MKPIIQNPYSILKALLLSIIILCFSQAGYSQIYLAGNQLSPGLAKSNYVTFGKSVNGKFFYLDTNYLHKYDNGLLSIYPRSPKNCFFSMDTTFIDDVEEFDGKLFISSIYKFKVGSDSFGICYFDGSSWKGYQPSKSLHVTLMEAAGNYLYFIEDAGNLTQVSKSGTAKLIAGYQRFSNIQIASFNNSVAWTSGNYFYKFDGTKFDSLAIGNTTQTTWIYSVSDTEVVFKRDPKIYKVGKSFKLEILDNAAAIYTYFLGGKDSLLYFKIYSSPTWVYKALNPTTKTYTDVIGISDDYYSGSFNKIYTWNFNFGIGGNSRISELVEGISVEGTIYSDKNQNCKKDAGEILPMQCLLVLDNDTSEYYVYTNDTGYYHTAVVKGTYKFKVFKKYLNTVYDSCFGSATLNLGTKYNLNIPLKIEANKKDISSQLLAQMGFRTRRGFTEKFKLNYENLGTTKENFIIIIEYPDSVSYASSTVSPASHSGRVLTFDIKNIKPWDKGSIDLEFTINSKFNLGRIIKFITNTGSNLNDLDTTNNTDTLCLKVVAAFDPNIKTSYPEGYVKKPVSTIKYNIQFQNEGTFKATRVIVVDTFDTRVPMTKLQMTGSKHPYTLRIEDNHILIWEFDNINLLPKSESDEGSRGFISFEAPLSQPLQIGQSIANRAHIYFDYEDAVPTPYAIVNVGDDPNPIYPVYKNTSSIQVFPNPSKNVFNIKSEQPIGDIAVFNTIGSLVYNHTSNDLETSINSENWPVGIYFIRFTSSGVSLKIVKQ